MTSLRFIQLLESYGAQPNHWPSEERAAALAFAEKFEDAKTLLSETQALDVALNASIPPAPSDLLRARVLKRAQTQATAPQAARVSRSTLLPFRAIAATLLVGVFVGISSGYLSPQNSEDTQTLYAEQSYDWLDEVFTPDLLDEDTP